MVQEGRKEVICLSCSDCISVRKCLSFGYSIEDIEEALKDVEDIEDLVTARACGLLQNPLP